MQAIPHSKPFMGTEEAQAAYDVVMSGMLAYGQKSRHLEQEWLELVGAENAAFVSSGFTALRLALLSLGVKPKDEILVPAYTCTALHSSVMNIGAIPVLCDIKAGALTLDGMAAQKKITQRTKAAVIPHLFGERADIANLKSLLGGVPIIEDCAHAPYKTLGDLSISSFYPTKYIASAGSGIVAGSAELIEKVIDLRYYGDREPSPLRQNDISNDLSAAIVLEQLKKLQEIWIKRTNAANKYSRLILDSTVEEHIESPLPRPTNRYIYRYTIRLKNHLAADISDKMKAKKICCEQPAWDYRNTIEWPNDLPNTDTAFDRVLSLPFYVGITEDEQRRVVETLGGVLNE